jgi:methionine synthase II (cobalamin-independent)
MPPDPALAGATAADRIRATVVELEAAGLELVASGEPLDLAAQPDPAGAVEAWHLAASVVTKAALKQVLPGPYSAGRDGARSAEAWAETLNPTIAALAEAGCAFIAIDEPDALAISVVASERRRFIDAHRRLTDGITGVHLSLTLTGGNVDEAGAATFFDLPYASFAFDLIAGPDNWRLIAAAPGDRGVICGAMPATPGGDTNRDVLVWAAHYAGSTGGRGLARVGLANASSLAGLPRAEALSRLAIVADAARIAGAPPEEIEGLLDPRATGRRAQHRGSR